MEPRPTSAPPAAHRPALAWLAAIAGAWVFVLAALGALTTTIGAGMVFRDWPLSNGSVSPAGWLDDLAEFAEHAHRLSGATMGVVTALVAAWVLRVDARPLARRLAIAAVVLVVVQGLLGGMRVLFDAVLLPGGWMTLGQLLRIPHGVVAQVFACVVLALAAVLSRAWARVPHADAVPRRLGAACVALLLVQLVVAATMRHDYAGTAIATFPLSTPEGDLLPRVWDRRVALAFAHRAIALAVVLALVAYGVRIARHRGLPATLRAAGASLVVLVVAQAALGGAAVLSHRAPYVTTAHVLLGTITLAATVLVTMFAARASAPVPAECATSRVGSAPVAYAQPPRTAGA